MEMRIVVPDATCASALAERLTVAFGARRISRLDDRPEVGVQVGRHSDRAVLRVLDAVDGWLDHAGVGFADMRLGKRSYRVARWAPVESWQRPSRDPRELAGAGESACSGGPHGGVVVLRSRRSPVSLLEAHPSTVDQRYDRGTLGLLAASTARASRSSDQRRKRLRRARALLRRTGLEPCGRACHAR